MEDIKEFLIEKVKEKHIIDNILNFYYEDWEEVQFKELKRRIYLLNKSYRHFFYNFSSDFTTEETVRSSTNVCTKIEIERLERKLTFLKYQMIKKYEQIGDNN